jgi:hypothetical protein
MFFCDVNFTFAVIMLYIHHSLFFFLSGGIKYQTEAWMLFRIPIHSSPTSSRYDTLQSFHCIFFFRVIHRYVFLWGLHIVRHERKSTDEEAKYPALLSWSLGFRQIFTHYWDKPKLFQHESQLYHKLKMQWIQWRIFFTTESMLIHSKIACMACTHSSRRWIGNVWDF